MQLFGLHTPGVDQDATASIDFTIKPREDFYVVAGLTGNGQNGIGHLEPLHRQPRTLTPGSRSITRQRMAFL